MLKVSSQYHTYNADIVLPRSLLLDVHASGLHERRHLLQGRKVAVQLLPQGGLLWPGCEPWDVLEWAVLEYVSCYISFCIAFHCRMLMSGGVVPRDVLEWAVLEYMSCYLSFCIPFHCRMLMSGGVVVSEQHEHEGGEPVPDAGRLPALRHGAGQAGCPRGLEGHLLRRL